LPWEIMSSFFTQEEALLVCTFFFSGLPWPQILHLPFRKC
jgi:hypothetical protein